MDASVGDGHRAAQTASRTLPSEQRYQATWRSMANSWLMVLAALLVGNSLAGHYINESGYQIIEDKWRLMFDLQQPVDWEVFGDSTALDGVMPSILEAKLGSRSLNLATHAGVLLIPNAELLDLQLQRIGPPKRAVIVAAATTWPRPQQLRALTTLSRTPLPWGFWHRLEPHLQLTPGQDWAMFLYRYCRIWSSDLTIANWLKSLPRRAVARLTPSAAAPATPASERGDPLLEASSEDLQKGWQVGRIRTPEKVRKSIPRLGSQCDLEFGISDINRRVVEAISRFATEQGFEVYYAHGPVLQEAYDQAPTVRRYLQQADRGLAALIDPLPHCHYVRGVLLLPTDAMSDGLHTNPRGARAYSAALAAALARLRDHPAEATAFRVDDAAGLASGVARSAD